MSSRKAHNRECLMILGEEYDNVNAWMDGLACDHGLLNINHRRYRHHKEGVEEVRAMWGNGAARAAEIHIENDFGGWIPTRQQVEQMYSAKPEYMRFEDIGKG